MLEKSHHGSFESCDGTLFFVIQSLEVATHVHIYCLSICLFLSLWACVAPPGLYYTWSFIPHLTSLRSVGPKDKSPTQSLRSFVFRWGLTLSSSVTTRDSPSKLGLSSRCSIGSNSRAPLGLWIITSSWLSAGVGSTGRIPLGLWIITSSWLPAYHHFLTVTYLQDAEHGHVF